MSYGRICISVVPGITQLIVFSAKTLGGQSGCSPMVALRH